MPRGSKVLKDFEICHPVRARHPGQAAATLLRRSLDLITLAALLILLCLTTPAFAQNPSTTLQTQLRKIQTIQANFQQRVYSENQQLLHTYNGNMQFKKPNQFRWEVTQPDPTLLITDGKKLWNYDIGLEQVTVQKYTANKEVTPLSFVLDDAESLPKNFNIEQMSNSCYKLTPKQENSNFVNVAVCFKRDQITSVNILDHLGQNSVFEFSQIKNNLNIPTQRFAFNPPAGVDIVGE